MADGSIYDNPLFRLLVVIAVIIVVITFVAANAGYFGEQLPLAQIPAGP
jgi:hypothetical protein